MHPELRTALEKYVESRSREDRVLEAPLFATRDGTPWSPRMIQDRVETIRPSFPQAIEADSPTLGKPAP